MGRIQNVKNRYPITNRHILDLITECLQGIKALGYQVPDNLSFKQCQATRRAGLACYADCLVVLSTFTFKESDKALRELIYHEIAHIIAGPGVHHGPKWQTIVNKINNRYQLNISRCYSDEDMPIHAAERKQQARYIFQCTRCGITLRYSRRTTFVRTYNEQLSHGAPRWTCSCCGGTFTKLKS